MNVQVSRRGFLQGAATAGAAALIIGTTPAGVLAARNVATNLNPFVRIDERGIVTIIIKHFEMGQGTTTGLATLVAEELDADWATVNAEFAPADNKRYANLFFRVQGTGGSTAIANSYLQYRQAGAMARDLLIRAAAKKWGVDASTITITDGKLKSGGKSGHFGEFVAEAVKLTPAEKPKVKSPDQFRLIGKQDLPRKDSQAKSTGTATFAMDVKVPNMVYAAIQRSPKFGGMLKSFSDAGAKKVSGFIAAKALPNKAGVVVYAKNTWAAFQARDAITAEWDFANAETRSTDALVKAHLDLLAKPEYQTRPGSTTDQAAAAVAKADRVVEAEFTMPFLVHAPMEPLNCVIEPNGNGVTVHDGCQFPGLAQPTIAFILKLKPEQVDIRTVYAGGSFGRRATPQADYHVEAALAYALLGGQKAVKLVWSREDDIRGGYYRPMAAHRAKIGLDAKGNITAWDHRIAAKSIMKGTPFEQVIVHNGIDHSSVEGVPDTLYQIPGMAVGLTDFKSAVPVLWWRSVGHTHTAYAMESLMDMVAHETGRDPVEMRLAMLDRSDAKQKRMAGVIEAARDLAGWKPGQKRGFAAHFSFNTYVAVVADVTVKGREVHVDKLHIAVDCGVAVNPDVIRAQMEGGAGYGLGAIMRNKVNFEDGNVTDDNFTTYEPLRITDMPDVAVKIVASAEAPTGVGEPATPPTGPAVANAIFAVSGKRITTLPMTDGDWEFV